MIAPLAQQLGWLVLLALIWLASAGLGSATLRSLNIHPKDWIERQVLNLTVGWAVLGAVLTGLGLMSLLSPTTIFVVLGLMLGLAIKEQPWRGIQRPSSLSALDWAWCLVLTAAALMTLLGALSPDVGFDSTWYHLPDAQRFLAEHSLAVHTESIQDVAAFLPKLPALFYAVGLSFDAHQSTLPQLLHWLAGLAFLLGTYALARRVSTRTAALAATTVLATAPTIIRLGQSAYVDLFPGAFGVALPLAALLWYDESNQERTATAYRILCGLLLGTLLATKLQAIFFVPAVALGMWFVRRNPIDTLIVLAFGGMIVLPWYVLVFQATGSPLGIASSWPAGDVHYGGGQNSTDWLLRVHPQVFARRLVDNLLLFNPILLLSPLALFLRSKSGKVTTALVLVGLITYLGWSYNPVPEDRYGIVVYPLLAVGIAALVAQGKAFRNVLMLGIAIFVLTNAVLIKREYFNSAGQRERWQVALGQISRADYLTHNTGYWIYTDPTNEIAPITGTDQVLWFVHNPFYLNVEGPDLIRFRARHRPALETLGGIEQALEAEGIRYLLFQRPFTLNSMLEALTPVAEVQQQLREQLSLRATTTTDGELWEWRRP